MPLCPYKSGFTEVQMKTQYSFSVTVRTKGSEDYILSMRTVRTNPKNQRKHIRISTIRLTWVLGGVSGGLEQFLNLSEPHFSHI